MPDILRIEMAIEEKDWDEVRSLCAKGVDDPALSGEVAGLLPYLRPEDAIALAAIVREVACTVAVEKQGQPGELRLFAMTYAMEEGVPLTAGEISSIVGIASAGFPMHSFMTTSETFTPVFLSSLGMSDLRLLAQRHRSIWTDLTVEDLSGRNGLGSPEAASVPCRLGMIVAAHVGRPLDTEWCQVDDLQARVARRVPRIRSITRPCILSAAIPDALAMEFTLDVLDGMADLSGETFVDVVDLDRVTEIRVRRRHGQMLLSRSRPTFEIGRSPVEMGALVDGVLHDIGPVDDFDVHDPEFRTVR